MGSPRVLAEVRYGGYMGTMGGLVGGFLPAMESTEALIASDYQRSLSLPLPVPITDV